MAPPVALPAEAGLPALSEPARVLNAFIAPSKTFTDLRRNASWWGPLIVTFIVTMIFVVAMDRQIGFETISRNAIATSSRADQFEKLPADQKGKQIQLSTTITRYASYGSIVIVVLANLVIALVLWATFMIFGGNTGFKTALAIQWYGGLPFAIHGLLGAASMFAGVEKDGFNPQNPVGSNPAYYMDPTGNKFVLGMASALDIFVIWSIILLGIGFACNSKIKRGTAISVVGGLYLLYKLVGSGIAAAMS